MNAKYQTTTSSLRQLIAIHPTKKFTVMAPLVINFTTTGSYPELTPCCKIFSEANSSSATQGTNRLLWNQKVYCHVDNSQPMALLS
jgi:hypothetical protein